MRSVYECEGGFNGLCLLSCLYLYEDYFGLLSTIDQRISIVIIKVGD